jgi:hypothetical protein
MNKQQALQKLGTLPGGLLDERQQLGVRVKFKGLGDIEALPEAIAADPWLLGTQLSGTHSFLNLPPQTSRKETTLTTFAALQAPKAIDILLTHGFEIAAVDASVNSIAG